MQRIEWIVGINFDIYIYPVFIHKNNLMVRSLLLIIMIHVVPAIYGQEQAPGFTSISPPDIEKASPFDRYADTLSASVMQDFKAHAGEYALVAGGSKGIGYAIAEALASRGYNLVLIARHWDSLEAAKEKLESKYKVQVTLLSFDLSLEKSATEIARWCTEKNIKLKMLCNVAGFGGARDYLSLGLDTLRYMSRLNIESCMALSLTLLPLLEKNSPSYILNVASMGGLAPIPVKNFYSATKSAIICFSYSLRYQLKKKDISVSVLCPGPVFTKPEIEEDTKKKLGWFGMRMAVSPKKVGEVAVRETLDKRLLIVPGGLAKFMSVFLRMLPMRWAVAIYDKVGGDPEAQ